MSTSKFKVGDRVILGEHQEVNGSKNWSDKMDKYVGKETIITRRYGNDQSNCWCWYVEIDGEVYCWREISMQSVIEDDFICLD